ncbi:MAG: RNA polymerase sigma factor [Planctomycetota bacterium]
MQANRLDPTLWVHRHGDMLFSYALARLGSREDAEDAVQEALLAGVHALSGFDGRSSESTWLVGILRHKVFDMLRRRSRESTWQDRFQQELATTTPACRPWGVHPSDHGSTSSLERLEREEVLQRLGEAIRGMPEVMRQVFYLTQIDGLRGPEVCALLDITPANLWTLVHRARLWLRRELSERPTSSPV